jgi:DNA primase
MIQESNLYERAATYHRALPNRIRHYLNTRGIPDELIDLHRLGWNGQRITIPIFDAAGELVFFKLAKDPQDQSASPKMRMPRGASIELYGWQEVQRHPRYLIICEGEFDRLVLEAHDFIAVTSTGGAGTFREEWAREFAKIPHLYVCYDRDTAGKRGAAKVGRLLPHAKRIALPADVGDGGDVTDFFVRLGRSRQDFATLMKDAEPVPPPPVPVIREDQPVRRYAHSGPNDRVARIKSAVSIADIVQKYVKLRPAGSTLVGLCPFHDDRNPSLTVYPATNTFYCFGCIQHGDVIAFVQEIEQVRFGQALDMLDSVIRYHDWKPE